MVPPGTGCDQEGEIRGTGMVGNRVEVITRSGRRAGRVVHRKDVAPRLVEKQGLVNIPVKFVEKEHTGIYIHDTL